MTLSLFDQQLFEKVVDERYKDKTEFTKTEVLLILNEMTKAEKYYPKGNVIKGAKYKVFKYFVRYCLYRNLANYDTMLLISGSKGTGKSSFAIMLAREWCTVLGISFSARHHMAYSNQQVQERIDNLPRFHPLVCLTGTTKVFIKSLDKPFPYYTKINTLVGRTDFEILSYDKDNKQFEFVKPEKCIMTSNSAKVYELELESGQTIRVTENHKFLTTDGIYKNIHELIDNDEIVLYSINCLNCNKEFSPRQHTTQFCCKRCNDKYKQVADGKRDKYLAYQKEYRQTNSVQRKLKQKEYRNNNVEKVRLSKQLERQKHKEKYATYQKEYGLDNKETLLLKRKEWEKKNKVKIRAYYNKRHKILMQTSPSYKIARNLRRRVNLALRNKGMIKDISLSNYLMCTIPELKKHLETKFKPGMTWNNYGSKWHIDHIIPCNHYDLRIRHNKVICFNYTNLQPLWAKENLSKGAKC